MAVVRLRVRVTTLASVNFKRAKMKIALDSNHEYLELKAVP